MHPAPLPYVCCLWKEYRNFGADWFVRRGGGGGLLVSFAFAMTMLNECKKSGSFQELYLRKSFTIMVPRLARDHVVVVVHLQHRTVENRQLHIGQLARKVRQVDIATARLMKGCDGGDGACIQWAKPALNTSNLSNKKWMRSGRQPNASRTHPREEQGKTRETSSMKSPRRTAAP